ncbi:hypothetical protein [Streptomyces enissocaesilis]|uniref:hypothetical protein n=1 Tax=Streptomyces enissocaesilis TaxID=332589 RepID=UPI0031DB3911
MRGALALGAAAATAVVSSAAVTARADDGSSDGVAALGAFADQQPSCGDPASPDFPLTTRLRGGPDTYRAGGAAGEWRLELTNATDRSCRSIHPVVVLTDKDRELDAGQVELEFDDGAGRWIGVPFETTDEDEHIGVFDGGFPGFTVAAGRTVTVKVRLAFDSGTVPTEAVANAAVVQRQPDDGEWVGESNDYRFAVVGAKTDTGTGTDTHADVDTHADSDPDAETGSPVAPEPDAPTGSPDGHRPGDDPRSGLHEPPALARTGQDHLPVLGALAGAFVLGGAALVAVARRHRAPHR